MNIIQHLMIFMVNVLFYNKCFITNRAVMTGKIFMEQRKIITTSLEKTFIWKILFRKGIASCMKFCQRNDTCNWERYTPIVSNPL